LIVVGTGTEHRTFRSCASKPAPCGALRIILAGNANERKGIAAGVGQRGAHALGWPSGTPASPRQSIPPRHSEHGGQDDAGRLVDCGGLDRRNLVLTEGLAHDVEAARTGYSGRCAPLPCPSRPNGGGEGLLWIDQFGFGQGGSVKQDPVRNGMRRSIGWHCAHLEGRARPGEHFFGFAPLRPYQIPSSFGQGFAERYCDRATGAEDILLDHYLSAIRPRQILSLCCGFGGLERYLFTKLPPDTTCLGINLAPGAIKTARERSAAAGRSDRLEYRVGDLNRWTFPADSFDVVLAAARCIIYQILKWWLTGSGSRYEQADFSMQTSLSARITGIIHRGNLS
jgi:Methyltransferase domain